MRIAFFTDNYRPLIGGIESSVATSEAALRKLGHEVSVVCPHYPDLRNEPENVIRVRSITPGIDLRGVAMNYRAHVLLPWLPRALKELQADIVHAHTPGTVGIAADMFARQRAIPLVYTFHSLASEQIVHSGVSVRLVASMASRLFPLYQGATGRTSLAPPATTRRDCQEQVWRYLLGFAHLADAVIAPSPHVAELLTERGLRTMLHVQPSGVDTAFFDQDHNLPPDLAPLWQGGDSVTLVCLGRLTPEKRPLQVVTALSLLPADLKCRVVFVGDGSERSAAANLAKRLRISDRVLFVGTRQGKDKAAVLQRSNGLILASNGFETQGLAILEGISAGLPVIYCDRRLSDAVSPETAILTDPSPNGLARGIEALVRDRARRERMANAARLLSRRFDSLLVSRELAQIYEATIRRRRNGSGSGGSPAGQQHDDR